MGGGADGGPALLVGLPGRSPHDPLHAEVTNGSLLICLSGPCIESVQLSTRGMRCISQVCRCCRSCFCSANYAELF